MFRCRILSACNAEMHLWHLDWLIAFFFFQRDCHQDRKCRTGTETAFTVETGYSCCLCTDGAERVQHWQQQRQSQTAVTVQTSGGRTQCQEEKEDTSVMEFLYKTPTVQGSRWWQRRVKDRQINQHTAISCLVQKDLHSFHNFKVTLTYKT